MTVTSMPFAPMRRGATGVLVHMDSVAMELMALVLVRSDTGHHYRGDSYSFDPDVNECVEETHDCHTNATCYNSIGSFTCSCNEGFEGNGVLCSSNNTNCPLYRIGLNIVPHSN